VARRAADLPGPGHRRNSRTCFPDHRTRQARRSLAMVIMAIEQHVDLDRRLPRSPSRPRDSTGSRRPSRPSRTWGTARQRRRGHQDCTGTPTLVVRRREHPRQAARPSCLTAPGWLRHLQQALRRGNPRRLRRLSGSAPGDGPAEPGAQDRPTPSRGSPGLTTRALCRDLYGDARASRRSGRPRRSGPRPPVCHQEGWPSQIINFISQSLPEVTSSLRYK